MRPVCPFFFYQVFGEKKNTGNTGQPVHRYSLNVRFRFATKNRFNGIYRYFFSRYIENGIGQIPLQPNYGNPLPFITSWIWDDFPLKYIKEDDSFTQIKNEFDKYQVTYEPKKNHNKGAVSKEERIN